MARIVKQIMMIEVTPMAVVENSAKVGGKSNFFYHPDCEIFVIGYTPKRHEQIAHLIMCALQNRGLSSSLLRYNGCNSKRGRKVSDRQKKLF